MHSKNHTTSPQNLQTHVVEKFTLIYVTLFTLLGVYLAVFNQSYFDTKYTLEDGFLEWLTFVSLSTIAATFFYRCCVYAPHKNKMFFVITLFISLLFIFGAGEEISWGQRLFAIESSDFFLENNAQNETNLHNLVVNGVKINQLLFGKGLALIFLIYLGIMTPLYNKKPGFAAFIDRCGIPIPQTYQAFAYLITLICVEVIIKNYSDTGRRGELTEFSVSFIVMLNLVFPKNIHIYSKNKYFP